VKTRKSGRRASRTLDRRSFFSSDANPKSHRRTRPLRVEQLEDRRVLATLDLTAGGILTFTLDSGVTDSGMSAAGGNLTFDAGAGQTVTLSGVAAGNGFVGGAQTATGSAGAPVAVTQINVVGAAGVETFFVNALTDNIAGLNIAASVETTRLNSASINTQDIATNDVLINSPAVILNASASIDTNNAVNDGDVTFTGSVNANTASGQGLTIATGAGNVNLAAVGNLGIGLGELILTGTTGLVTLSGDITTDPAPLSGDVNFSGATGGITLASSITINSDGNGGGIGGDVNFAGTAINAAAASGQGLTINSADGNVTLNAVGNLGIGLGFLSVTSLASTTLNGNITTDPVPLSGDISILSAVGGIILGSSVTLNSDGNGGGIGGDVTLAGGPNAAAAGVQGLTIIAGTTGGDVNTGAPAVTSALAFLTIGPAVNITMPGSMLTTGPVSLTAQDQVTVNNINAGASTVTISANQNAAGAEGFSQSAGAITTTNNTSTAVGITVNTAAGGTGNALLRTISVGAGAGRITVLVDDGVNDADGGEISDAANDAAVNLTAFQALLVAATGIGDTGAVGTGRTLETTVAELDASNSASGAIFITDLAGGLTLANIGGPNANAVSGVGGLGEIRAGSPLTIAADAATTGGITYSADDSAAAGDNITLNLGVDVSDTTAGLIFNVGDNLELDPTSTITAATTVTINLDATGGGVADPGTGSTTTIDGTVTSTGGTTAVNGFTDSDTLTIASATSTVENLGSSLLFSGGGGAATDTLTISDFGDATGDGTLALPVDISSGGAGAGTISRLIDANPARTIGFTGLVVGSIVNLQTGNTGADVVEVTPNANVIFNLDGNLPGPLPPGDTLVYDGNGTKTITGQGTGQITGVGVQPVNFQEFEEVRTTAGNLLDDVIDVAALDTPPNADPNLIVLRRSADGLLLEILFDGNTNTPGDEVIVSTQLHASINTLTVIGDGDNDSLRIQETAGGLPNFPGANASGHTNAAFTARSGFAPVPSIHFEGNTGVNSLALNLAAAASARNVIYTTDTNEANSGVVQAANAAVTTVVRLSFDELSPVDVIGPGVLGGDLLVDATATPAVTSLAISDDTTAAALAAFPGPVPAASPIAGANFIDGDDGFEDVRFSGFTRLIVVGGDGGETIDLIGLDMGAGNPLTSVILDGDNTTNTDVASDTLRVRTLPAGVTATLLGGAGSDLFQLDSTPATVNDGVTAGIAGAVLVSTSVAAAAGTALPAGLPEEGGAADTLYADDGSGAAGRTVTLDSDATSATIEGMTGFAGAPDIRYNFPVSALNPAPNLIETINIDLANAFADTANVRFTSTGSTYFLRTGSGAVSDTVNISSDAPANAGVLDAIDGQVNIAMGGGVFDAINISDFGDTAGDTYTLDEVGAITRLAFADGAAALDIRYNVNNTTPASTVPTVLVTPHDVEDFLLVGANALAASNTYNILATTATFTNTVNDGDATVTGVGNNANFNITGDTLSAANLFRGFDGNDDFDLDITGHIGDAAVAGSATIAVTIEGNANIPAFNSANRDFLTINDNLGGTFARNLVYDYQDTQGDLDIEAGAAGAGLFGPNGGGSVALLVRTMETLRFNGDAANDDTTAVAGTSVADDITVALSSGLGAGVSAASSAFVFVGGDPYITSPGAIVPPDSLAGNFPGVAGGGTAVDMLINGIDPAGITLDGELPAGSPQDAGNRAIVQAISEAHLSDPVALAGGVDVFDLGLGAGVLVPGSGALAAYDLIAVNGAAGFDPDIGFAVAAADQVVAVNIVAGLLVPVTVLPLTFQNGVLNTSRAGLIVNGGDEAAARGGGFVNAGIADNFFVTAHPLFNIGINGNLPPLGPLAPDGFPAGDQLNQVSPTSFSIWSDKAVPPNVNIVQGNNPFGIIQSSIERTRLTFAPGANHIVNLIGDDNDPTVDQTDNFVVVGTDIDPAGSPDAGVQEAVIVINGSAPILVDEIQRLNVYGYDLVGQDLNNPDPNAPDVPATPATADDIDTLELTAYADNAGGLGANAPRGWGVDVLFNEGSPAQLDGDQTDLLIYHTSAGLGGGGSVSEDIVIQPSGPDNGEVRATNAVDGSVIVVVSYIANTDIIVVDDDGAVSDTDSLTLRGTNPDTVQTSGNETFVVDFDAAGTVAAPFVTVTDTTSGLILYRLRSFTDPLGATGPIATVNIDMLAGNDTLRFRTPIAAGAFTSGVDQVNVLGGLGDDSVFVDVAARDIWNAGRLFFDGGAGADSLTATGTPSAGLLVSATYTPGPIAGNGRLVLNDGADQIIDFVSLAPVVDLVPADTLTVNANKANNAINYSFGSSNGVTTAVVSIDEQETITFANQIRLVVNALAGDDTVNINNSSTPTLLTAITVNGGDPTASDTVIVNVATAATVGTLTTNSAIVTRTGEVTVNVNTTELLKIVGDGTTDLEIEGTAASNVITHTPGAANDAGGVTVDSLLPVTYQNLGAAALFTIDGGGAVDTLVARGTDSNDTFTVPTDGDIALNTRVEILDVALENLTLDGLNGDDRFNITGGHPYAIINVQGGSPSASDVLFLTGAAAVAETVTIAPDAVNPTEQDVTGLGGTINVSGVELIRYVGTLSVLGAADDTLIINPLAHDDSLRVANSANSGLDLVTSNVLPDIEFGGLVAFQIEMIGTGTVQATFFTRFLTGAASYQLLNSFEEDTLVIEGLDGGGGVGNDSYTVTNPAADDVTIVDNLSGVTVRDVTGAGTLGRVILDTRGGDDAVIVDVGGPASDVISIPITFDGGAGSDILTTTGTPVTPVAEVIYSPGPSVTEGRLRYESAADLLLMVIDFLNLEPIFDLIAALTLTVNGDNGDNAINYTQGSVAANGRVTVDAYEAIEFSNKTNLVLNGLAGSDTFNLNNPSTPNLLIGITVNGGDPTASDTVIVNGTTAPDAISIGSFTEDGAVVTGAQPVPVTIDTAEHLTINGLGGNDTLTITAPNSNEVEYTPDVFEDAGSVAISSSSIGPVQRRLPFNFRDLGAGGSLTFASVAGTRNYDLRVLGTQINDRFDVSPTGVVQAFKRGTGFFVTLPMNTPGVDELFLEGLDGDDEFDIVGNHPFTAGVHANGGNPGASDELDFTASAGGVVEVNLGASTVTQTGSGPVNFTGIETIDLVAGGAAATTTIVGTVNDDDLTVTAFSATAGKVEIGLAVQQSGQVAGNVVPPLINYSNLGTPGLAVDMAGGEDTLVVVGNAFAQTWVVDALAAGGRSVSIDDVPNGVGNDGLVTLTNTESLEVFGLEGNDFFLVLAGEIPVFVDGGDPIGTVPGDSIFVLGAIVAFPGPESDEGGFLTGPGGTVSFDHIEELIVGPNGPCPFLILGTNADDDITVIARDDTYIIPPAPVPPGLDGLQDFTVSVNAGPDILFIDEPDLFIDALNGDDDIVVRAPAPNLVDWDVHVRIAGGPPSAVTGDQGDVVEFETPGTNTVIFTPTGSDTGTLLLDENANGLYDVALGDSLITIGPFVFICDDPPGPPIEFTYNSSPGGAEEVVYDGETGNDIFAVVGTAVDDTIVHTPADAIDEGTFRVNSLLGVRYQNLGTAGQVIADGAGGVDTLVARGTLGSDTVDVSSISATEGSIAVNNQLPLRTRSMVLPVTNTVERYQIEALEGDDDITINYPLATGVTQVAVNAGGPGGSDSLTVSGAAGVDEAFTITPGLIPGDGNVQVNAVANPYTGIEHVFVDGSDADNDDLTIVDDLRDNLWTVSAGSITGDRVQIDGRESFDFNDFNDVTLTNIFGTDLFRVLPSNLVGFDGIFTVNGDAALPIDDVLQLLGTPGADVVTSTATAVTVNGVTITAGVNLIELRLETFAGADNINLDLLLPGTRKHVNAGSENDVIDMAGTLDALIIGGLGDDIIIGTPLADLIYGDDPALSGGGNDTISAGGGDDFVFAGAGNDLVIGQAGVDHIDGQEGNDIIGNLSAAGNGVADDPGNDFFFGGDGSDIFVWEPGDGSDTIEGGDGSSDILTFIGGAGVDNFTLSAVGTRLSAFRLQAAITLDTADVEVVNLNGLAGADTFDINDLYPTAVQVVNTDFGLADAAADRVTIQGRDVSDEVNITPVGAVVEVTGLRYDVNVLNAGSGAEIFEFFGNNGNDNIVSPLDASLVPFFASALFTLSGGLGDDFITGYGTLNGNEGNDTLIGGSEAQTINGGDGDDLIRGGGGGDALNGDAGEDTFLADFDNVLDTYDGGADFDTILIQATSANDRIDVIQDNPTQIRFNVLGLGGGTGIVGGAGTQVDALAELAGNQTVEELEIQAGSGDDTIRVAHADSLVVAGVAVDMLRFTVDGGAPGASDRLTVTDLGPGDTTVQRIGGIAGDGSFTMYSFLGGVPANGIVPLPPVNYTDVEFASLNPLLPITGGTGADGNGRLFVFKHDPYEQNNSLLNATFLGANETTNVDPTIDPGTDGPFGLPGDEDWYRIVAEHNGTLDIQVYFDQQGTLANGRAGLPSEGNLEIALYDVDGLIGAAPAPGAIAGNGVFGTNDTDDNERIRIPAVAGQTYYLRVVGAPFPVGNVENTSAAINIYNVAVINTPAPVPFDLELDDRIVGHFPAEGVAVVALGTTTSFNSNLDGLFPDDFFNGKVVSFKFDTPTTPEIAGEESVVLDYVGATGVFTLAIPLSAAPAAGDTFQVESVDTGRNNNDNITRDTTPTIFLRVPDVVNVGGVANLDDLPYNGVAPGNPPDQFIGIPFVSSLLLDVPALSAGFRVPIFVVENGTSNQDGTEILAGYAQPVDPVNNPGLFSFTFGSVGSFIPTLTPDGSYFISARVEMIDPAQNINPVPPFGPDNQEQAQGYGAFADSLEIFVDTVEPPVSFGDPGLDGDGLAPDSDSFVIPNPETIIDLVTNDLTPTFWGRAEADATVRLFADAFFDANGNGEFDFTDVDGDGVFEPGDGDVPLFGDLPPDGVFQLNTDVFIGQDTAIPLDGNQQEPNGFWKIESVVNFNDPRFFLQFGGLRTIFVTAEDVAGNVNDNILPEELEIFIDVQGPQITDVTINVPSQFGPAGNAVDDFYDLFDPKPSTDGPTPLVNSIWIEIQDLPNRVLPDFDQPAFKPDIAENPGHYLVTGDYNGIFPILEVHAFLDPAVDGQPATGRVQLVFRTEGPDGQFDTSDDIGKPLFDDRFTLFVSEDGIIDFAGNKLDGESNADEPHDSPPPGPGFPDVLGVDGVPTGDGIAGGDFFARFTIDSRPELAVWAGGSIWVDANGNNTYDSDALDFSNRDFAFVFGFTTDEIFAGKFMSVDDPADRNVLFDKTAAYGRVGTDRYRWLIDTDNDGVPDIEVEDPSDVIGHPVAGNFGPFAGDEVGLFTGSTWFFDTNHDFDVDTSIAWPAGSNGRGIVGDFDGDGFDDLASWADDFFRVDLSSVGAPGPVLELNNPGLGTGVNGSVERIFRFGFPGVAERPVAADMNQDGIEDIGLWVPPRDGVTPGDEAEWYFLVSGVTQNNTPPAGAEPDVGDPIGPTITGTGDPTPGSYLASATGFYQIPPSADDPNYFIGRIVQDPLFPGGGLPSANIVRYDATPFGNDLYMQFGDQFAMPLLGNFDPPLGNPTGNGNVSTNPGNELDVNNDGFVTPIDALLVINHMNSSGGTTQAPTNGFITAPFLDVNNDGFVSPIDALMVINYLNSGGEGEGEGEAADAYFSDLGSGEGESSGDDVLGLLAADSGRKKK
jgi:hypothetical protein